MELSIPRPQPRTDGDYETFVDCGYGKPWAIIHLAMNGTLDLRDIDVDDCDRLIKAAVEVKTRLIAYQAEIAAPHDRGRVYQGTCQLCGKPEDDALHAEPVPVVAPQSLTSLRCHRHPERVYGACPECSAEIDASIARNGAPLSDGEIAALDAAAAAAACAECGHLVCDCAAGMGEDVTDSIAEGHDADAAAAVTEVRFSITPEALALGESIASGTPVIIADDEHPDCARPGCQHPRHHHWEFGPTTPSSPASGCDMTGCPCSSYAATFAAVASEIRDLRAGRGIDA